VNDGASVAREVGERQDVVVRRTRPAVEDDERRRAALAGDAVPRLAVLEWDRSVSHVTGA